jgi:hypothetical protein
MLGWRKLLGLAAVNAALFLLSGWTAQNSRHSGTVSNVRWVDFVLGMMLLIAVAAAAARVVLSRPAALVRRH